MFLITQSFRFQTFLPAHSGTLSLFSPLTAEDSYQRDELQLLEAVHWSRDINRQDC